MVQHVPTDLSSAEIKGASQAQPRQRILLLEQPTVSEHPRTHIALVSHSATEKSACETEKLPLSVTAFIPQ